jgi:hypothetical protein
MENKDWINDYKLLKQVSPANPFTVPGGYFDSLADRIVSLKNIRAWTENNQDEGFIVPENYFDELGSNIRSRKTVEDFTGKENTGFAVPDGYFEILAGNIESRITIEEAAKEDAGFTVPDGYFEVLTNDIESRIAIEEAFDKEDTGFAVPEGYFEELASAIQGRIAIEEAVGEPAEMFSVPDGYFDQLTAKILDKTANAEKVADKKAHAGKQQGAIIRRLISTTAFKYATAACFAVVIGGGVILTQIGSPNDHAHSFLHTQLSNVPINDIKTYLQLNVDAGDTQQTIATQGTNVNDKDLKEALKNYADSLQ